MGLFFKIETEADRKLMQDYDYAVSMFREVVCRAMEEAAEKDASIAGPFLAAAEAMRLRPLPSEVNNDPAALRRLALSGLVTEGAFALLFAQEKSPETTVLVMGVAARMREMGKTTIGLPEYRELMQNVIAATVVMKTKVAQENVGAGYEDYLSLLKTKSGSFPVQKPPRL